MSKKLGNDIQDSIPSTQISLSRVGVTGLKRVLRIKDKDRHDTLFFAEMNLYAQLDARKSGVHMSRFLENIENIATEIAMEPAPDIETLVDRISTQIAESQGAARAEARIRAQYPMTKTTPVSGKSVENLYTLLGISVSNGKSVKRAIGVEVNGLTVCPCAREMVAEDSRERLLAAGFTGEQAEIVLNLLPLASHNQRGLGTLIVGSERSPRIETLIEIVEDSMSSPIFGLLKRADELHVVREGHMKPRFVEDVVREMIRGAVERIEELSDDSFILARQENFESIHVHNAYAEKSGILSDIRLELKGSSNGRDHLPPNSLTTWLNNM